MNIYDAGYDLLKNNRFGLWFYGIVFLYHLQWQKNNNDIFLPKLKPLFLFISFLLF